MPEDLPDRDELLHLLGERARDGNVQAIRLLLDELRREDDDGDDTGFDALDGPDELAQRRNRKAS